MTYLNGFRTCIVGESGRPGDKRLVGIGDRVKSDAREDRMVAESGLSGNDCVGDEVTRGAVLLLFDGESRSIFERPSVKSSLIVTIINCADSFSSNNMSVRNSDLSCMRQFHR